jgi:polysaccharide deacetylase family protein (PEP-CTERM system associated)
MSVPATTVNAFTVDLEDWFQGLEIHNDRWGEFEDRLAIGTGRLLDLLDEAGVRATFFVLGSAAESAPDLVRLIHARGHEIGTHGHSHQFVYRMGAASFAADLARSLAVLREIIDAPIYGHRAPYFSITDKSPWAFQVMRDQGLRYDSSVFPVRNYRYGIPHAPRSIYRPEPGLVEFPISTVRLLRTNLPVGGGAYFRLLPYTLSRLGLRRINSSGSPAVFYIHPWELDPDQPLLELPRRISLTHYRNLAKTSRRLRKLLRDFRFAPMGQVLEEGGWLSATK